MPLDLNDHSAVFMQLMSRVLIAQGCDPDELFENDAHQDLILNTSAPRQTFRQIAGFFEQAAQVAQDPMLGLRHGRQQDFRPAGLIAYAGSSAETLGGFMANVARYFPIYAPSVRVQFGTDRGLQLHIHEPSSLKKRHYMEFLMALLMRAARHYTGSDLQARDVRFTHQAPAGRDELNVFFGCDVSFHADVTSLVLPSSALQRPLTTADPYLHDLICSLGDDLLALQSARRGSFVTRLEHEIAAALPSGKICQKRISETMGLSARTLSRRLAQHETSFFAVLDGLRHELALTYLSYGDMNLTEIAHALGYSGHSSFSEAFKRWTGHSPGRFRNL